MAKISVLTPVYNEEATVLACYEEVRQVFAGMGGGHTYEHIFGDNRSKDRTLEILKDLAARDPNVKILAYSRNFGAEKSSLTLMRHATGDACVWVMADTQEPPTLIPRMVEEWEAGHEIVVGVYTNRSDGILMRAGRSLYYRLVRWVSNQELDRDFSGFALLDRCVMEEIAAVDDFNPYIRGLVSTLGFNKIMIPYERRPRQAGESKHHFSFLMDFGLNAVISYSILPIRLATFVGCILSGLSILMSLVYAIIKITHWNFQAPGATTTIVLVLFFSGIQLLFLGVLGEYIGAIHSQVRRKPFIVIRERVNFPAEDRDAAVRHSV
jgi:glycosyltransferase involved in cell wall biosynthesis